MPRGIPTIANNAPRGPSWVPEKLAEIDRELMEIRAARTLENSSIGAGGITILDGGSIRVVDADGHVVALIGALPDAFDRSDGSAQPGVAFYREDGSLAAILGDGNPTVAPYRQAWQQLDRQGNVVLADDTNCGIGLAVPWVPLERPADTNIATWPATASTTWTQIATCYLQRQNPQLAFAIYCQADPSTSGRMRLTIDGTVIATSPTVTGGFSIWTGIYPWPSPWVFNSTAVFGIEAEVTAGAGTVRAQTLQLIGTQS